MNINLIPYTSIWFNILFSFFAFTTLNAQETVLSKQEQKVRAEQEIQNLQEGKLIVRLESNAKKIQKLRDFLDSKDLNEIEKENLKNLLDQTIQKTNKRNTLFIQAFQEFYNFSDILFTYDFHSEELLERQQKGYFLDKNLNIDNSLSLGDKKFLTLRFGNTDYATSSGAQGIIITDQKLKDLNHPFPYAVREGGFLYVFDKIFDKDGAIIRNIPRMVQKLNENLKRFHN